MYPVGLSLVHCYIPNNAGQCPALSRCSIKVCGRTVYEGNRRLSELGHTMAWGGRGREARPEGLTPGATGFLVAAIHAVSIRVTAPAQGDAVATLTLELVHITAGGAVFLWVREPAAWSGPWGSVLILPRPPPSLRSLCSPRLSRRHSHDPHHTSSAQRCSGRWHRRTHSRSRAEGLGKDRTQHGGHRASPALGNKYYTQVQGLFLSL